MTRHNPATITNNPVVKAHIQATLLMVFMLSAMHLIINGQAERLWSRHIPTSSCPRSRDTGISFPWRP